MPSESHSSFISAQKKNKKQKKHTRNFSRYVKFFKTDEEFIFNIAQPWPTLSWETLGTVWQNKSGVK